MRFLADLRKFWRDLGRIGQIFAVSVLVLVLLRSVNGPLWVRELLALVALATGVILTFRTVRYVIRQSIWRLRNRLLVAYLFIALVPVVLLIVLGFVAAWAMSGQIAVYLVTSEFDRRLDILRGAAQSMLRAPEPQRPSAMQRLGSFFSERFPEVEMVIVDSGREKNIRHFPEDSTLELPDPAWKDASGVVALDGEFFGWVNVADGNSRMAVVVPLTREYLGGLVPELGEISVVTFAQEETRQRRAAKIRRRPLFKRTTQSGLLRIPAALNRFDVEVVWGAPIQVAEWDQPGKTSPALFSVRSRISAVMKVLLSQKADWDNSWALVLIAALGTLFLIVETIALVIGVSLSRTITSAVHNLYEGTERVMEGDFSHRIRLKGRDQLAALGGSFNRMTENVERLLQVSKEKERYEAELSIAREVQAQLYPRSVPESASLSLTALYKPARMVSGDYYDYRRIGPEKIALAIGDVAGKGISAALLMATIQSAFRAQIRDRTNGHVLLTAEVVSQLNQHLHANTPPEKFATFFLGIYDEASSVLTYTNAGHLQPILVRSGQAQRLEVDGMVIGAFPFSKYGTSVVDLQRGDLIVWFTDGISEPENDYGEMFGEERLIELAVRNAGRSDMEIISAIVEAVEKWTGSGELQDDMTLLLARRK